MRYTSTRTASVFYTFEEAILGGYAPDGGLYVPEAMPKIDKATMQDWAKLSYVDLAATLLCMFVDEVPREEIESICRTAYCFDDPATVPIVKLKKNIFVAELFHGPTFCFKDLGLRILINVMAFFARKRNQRLTLLAATTGDTGPAAVQAVQDSGCELLSILVHYPKGQISDFQRKQLTTVDSPRVKIVEFEGGGDDMDAPIKRITSERSVTASDERLICGINSFNIGRPLAQMTHFFWTYLRVTEALGIEAGDPDFQLDVVIPTGAMGNMAAGYMSKQMGIPFGIFTAGVNINDFTNTAFQTGIVAKPTASIKMTLSEAINIQLPYNLERLLFYLTDENHDLLREWYATLDQKNTVNLGEWLQTLQTQFQSARVTDEELCSTLRSVLEEFGYWADPHTGVAIAAAQQRGYFSDESTDAQVVVALMATASPCKFQSAVTTALGKDKWQKYEATSFPERGKSLLHLPEMPPFVYTATDGMSLQENQQQWEHTARELIQTL